jgi:hypothetical protein
MEGRGRDRPGVASKVDALAQTIRRGEWCDEQGSLMRGFAYGVLDPEGERYRLAVSHHSQCSACRAYVLSLRGLAAALPLPPLPLSLTAALTAAARAGGIGGRAGGIGGRAAGTGATGVGARAAGAGAEAAGPGLAGAGGAGGGWLVAGGAAKFAVGCAVAVGIGAGCVALSVGPLTPRRGHHTRAAARSIPKPTIRQQVAVPAMAAAGSPTSSGSTKSARFAAPAGGPTQAPNPAPTQRPSTPAVKANREFGIEQPAGSASSSAERGPAEREPAESRPGESNQAGTATVASRPRPTPTSEEPATGSAPSSASTAQQSGSAAAAEREFGPG